MGLAYISLRDGSDDEALHLCEQALETNPENLYARVLRARVFFQKENRDQALGELTQALRTASGADWEASEAYTLLGRIQDVQGNADEALTSYERDSTRSNEFGGLHNKGSLSPSWGTIRGLSLRPGPAACLGRPGSQASGKRESDKWTLRQTARNAKGYTPYPGPEPRNKK